VDKGGVTVAAAAARAKRPPASSNIRKIALKFARVALSSR
jgi:hypothetical protein